ncbi:MAG: DUF5723 family protein [Bacteroidales bacterium]
MKKLLILNFFLIALALTSFGQHSQSLYYMDRLPQIHTMNPALQPTCNFYMGFPGISGVNLNIGNNSLAYEDIIFKSPVNDSLITFLHPDADVDDFLGQLKDRNSFFTEFSTNIFSFGFRAGEGYFSFGVMEKSDMSLTYPKDLARLLLKGNSQYKGETVEFGNLSVASNNYLEYAMGYSYNVLNNLTIGFKAKYLNGLANIRTEEFNLSLYTNEDGDSIALNSDIKLQANAPVEITTDSLGYIDEVNERDIDVSDITSNPGFAFDLGATYRLRDEFTFSASIVDLGFINYKNFAHNYSLQGQYSFTGIDVSSELTEDENDEESDPSETVLDSLENSISAEYSEDTYFETLGPKIFIGARYYLNKKVDFGILSRTKFYDDRIQQSFTLSANTRPIRGVSFTGSYSIINNSYNNLGMGLALRLGPLQVYTMSDMFSAGLWPQKTQSFNLRFGLNFVFGCNKQKRMLQNEPMLY